MWFALQLIVDICLFIGFLMIPICLNDFKKIIKEIMEGKDDE